MHGTAKASEEDVFLAALTVHLLNPCAAPVPILDTGPGIVSQSDTPALMWTDNGAATPGGAMRPRHRTTAPPYTELGPEVGFMNWNWSMVDTQ
eukprot:gene45-10948_t